jgi:hypothetical protein
MGNVSFCAENWVFVAPRMWSILRFSEYIGKVKNLLKKTIVYGFKAKKVCRHFR